MQISGCEIMSTYTTREFEISVNISDGLDDWREAMNVLIINLIRSARPLKKQFAEWEMFCCMAGSVDFKMDFRLIFD